MGSSPLSRGIHRRYRAGVEAARIIPALAGNTLPSDSRKSADRDHPRSRGEYLAPKHTGHCSVGSSPLSRGIHADCVGDPDAGRIIPALAGNTANLFCRTVECGDHPRSRGEYDTSRGRSPTRWGSSPLSRGIPSYTRAEATQVRIIPALAGNTWRREVLVRQTGDHPRSRGEYGDVVSRSRSVEGSSPLSRGIHELWRGPTPT